MPLAQQERGKPLLEPGLGNQQLQPHESKKQIPGCLERSDRDVIMEKGEKRKPDLKITDKM